jgi:hypothetical protein
MGKNNVTKLPHGTSLLDLKAALPAPADREEKDWLRIYSLESALIECLPQYFSTSCNGRTCRPGHDPRRLQQALSATAVATASQTR